MKYYRLIEDIPSRTPLGYGAAGGRWNSNGTPLIYACNHSSLNFIELLSIKGPIVTSTKWKLVVLEVEGDIPYIDPKDLPSDWKTRPYPASTQDFGTQWAQSMATPYLIVPSSRIPLSSYPDEHNLLINPLHPQKANLITVLNTEKVSFELNHW